MSRLTDENKEIISLLGNNESYWLSIYFKLKEYEDLEEQGLLLKLPCKVGDTVYVVGTICLADEEPEYWCKTTECEECIYNKTYIVFERKVDYMMIYDFVVGGNTNFIFNKTVFLTKEEAEQALKEMESAEWKE